MKMLALGPAIMPLPSKKSTEHVESAHDQDGDRRVKKDEPNKATDEARNKRLLPGLISI